MRNIMLALYLIAHYSITLIPISSNSLPFHCNVVLILSASVYTTLFCSVPLYSFMFHVVQIFLLCPDLFHSILFYSVMLDSITPCAILFHSVIFYSTLVYYMLSCSILFHSGLLYAILFYSIPLWSVICYLVLFYSTLFYSIPLCFILSTLFYSFHSILFHSTLYYSNPIYFSVLLSF